jgi:hypothetical protein
MNKQEKLSAALTNVLNICQLVEGNEYEDFLMNKLISIDVELRRQLTNELESSKIKE